MAILTRLTHHFGGFTLQSGTEDAPKKHSSRWKRMRLDCDHMDEIAQIKAHKRK